ncbi:uncharacterized protein LOC111370753 [Olea europaea var. sylvestris]|uniref:uncharacterized protein LOC111370753 n=1 Tax=Olea europaea var. sylvestris TaxID=158386 RepID=UPI000C1D2FC5|nr:uncharacterized protein LOC111370753 [Olea europaea var. sylvestris]
MGILEELRWTAMKLVNVGKFYVDSTVNESFKGGKQVYANVKEKLKGLPISPHSDGNKRQNYVAVEEMQAKLEKMQEDIANIKSSDGNKKQNYVAAEDKQAKLQKMQEDENDIKEQNEIIHRAKQLEHVKQFPHDPLKSSVTEVTGRKKIFIRSRL